MSGMIRYFRFLTDLIGGVELNGRSYEKLLRDLHDREFYYSVSMDANRVADALEMRSEYENRYKMKVKGYQPSVLEVMVALSCRCEDNIMGDSRYGNRVPIWFWSMIESIDLLDNDDSEYDLEWTNWAIGRVLCRSYEKDGKGGLFYIPGCKKDLRKVEIWYQMCWWVNSKYSFDIENEEG